MDGWRRKRERERVRKGILFFFFCARTTHAEVLATRDGEGSSLLLPMQSNMTETKIRLTQIIIIRRIIINDSKRKEKREAVLLL